MNSTKLSLIVLGILSLANMAGCAPAEGAEEMPTAALPVNKAFVDGMEIDFVHPEASDETAAQQMTEMMMSPTLYVPSLAQVPAEALADVYAFMKGADGQLSVFDRPPGTEGYTPLRQVNMAIWADGSTPRVLKSVAETMTAKEAGELAIRPTGIVVNMPFIT